jgi:hypothetical protein
MISVCTSLFYFLTPPSPLSTSYHKALPSDHLKVPLILQSPKKYEVNGSFTTSIDSTDTPSNSEKSHEITSFRVQLFARFSDEDEGNLTNFSQFRLFHMDFLGFLSASCAGDKGETLDSFEEESESIKYRDDNINPHIPYLRTLQVREPNHPANMNAKSVWIFEALDAFKSGTVSYNVPLRIKHVVTNK